MTPRSLLAVAALAAGLCGCAMNDGTMVHGNAAPMGAAAAAHLSAADMAFVQLAAGTDMYEIEASRLAIGRAPDTQVKGYAQMLIDHHTMSSNQMKALLHAKGVVPPAALPPDKQAKIAQLSRLQGRDFEREYIRMTGVADHQAAIGQFEQASRSLPDADLRNFAARTLPVLQQHLRAAQEIAGRMAG